MILFFTLFIPFFSFSITEGCKDQLKTPSWPLDCALELALHKNTKKDIYYTDLNNWCKLHSAELLQLPAPKPLLSLHLPEDCKKLVKTSLKHQESLDLLFGDFLNSFQ